MTAHRYRRQPGIKGTTKAPNGLFRSQANHLADVISLGTFDTAERASMAYRLFCHWVLKGHHPDTIPRQPRTRDAI